MMSSHDQQQNAAHFQKIYAPKLGTNEEVVPIFQKQKIDFDPPGSLICMCVCNNQLVMGLTKNCLIKIDLDKQSSSDEIELSKAGGDSIERLFMDPTGFHLIIVMSSAECFYLHKSSRKPRSISKMKGHKITAVAWNNQQTTQTSTGPILVGTSRGLLFELEFVYNDDNKLFGSSFEPFNKQIYDFTRDKHRPITGLMFDKLPNNNNSKANNYFLIVVVQARLYQFIGLLNSQSEGSMFGPLFTDVPERFQDIPCSINCSQIVSYGSSKSSTKFAWLTDSDVYYGKINLKVKNLMEDVITESRLIQIHDDKEDDKRPVSMVLTAFHCLVLFPDRMKAYCLLNDELVETDMFDAKFGLSGGLICDPMKKIIWTYTSKAVYKYNVVEETRGIWRMYLNMKEFNLAKQFCPNIDKHYEEILNMEADHLFSIEKYEECALLYAKSRKPFEEIALNLLKLDNKEPLKQFLKAKFNDLRLQEKIQLTMLMAWLVEIWLYEMGQLKLQDENKFKATQDEFRQFITTAKAKEFITTNHIFVYDLMLSHGNIEDLIFVATLIHDYDKVISHHIQHECFLEAINVLSRQDNMDLVYKYVPQLMKSNPKETVDLLTRRCHSLDPKRISNLLIKCDEGKSNNIMREMVRYLEFCLKEFEIQDKLFHNHLISLYIKLKLKGQLMSYLLQQGEDSELICYDMVYALRLCAEQNLHEACIQIYTTMQLYNEAVDLALKTDVKKAQETASKPREDDGLRRKLWLKITRHMIKQEGDVAKAMDFIKKCDLISIQDVLPYFPDFATIDHFKEAICLSLKKYNDEIESFKRDMMQSNEDAQEIKEQINIFKSRYVKVEKDDKCVSCHLPLTMRLFYIFPCKHKFHLDCLVTELLPHVAEEERPRVRELKKKALSDNRGKYKKELFETIDIDCVYCGNAMIESVDRPFIDEDKFELLLQSWL